MTIPSKQNIWNGRDATYSLDRRSTSESWKRTTSMNPLSDTTRVEKILNDQFAPPMIAYGKNLKNRSKQSTSAIAFEIAAKGAFRQTMPKAGAQLLEPVMKVDVFSPEDNVGDVIGDLNRRRGMISGQEPSSGGVRIKADVPLSEMFGYISSLRTMTSGRGQFSMEFSHYSACPTNIADEVIAKEKEKKAAKAK